MTKWTDEQIKAIYEKEQSVLVRAGAGSGKTAVLTERVAQLVLSKISVKNMLIVTYTNAAASEMKRRISSRLQELMLLEEHYDDLQWIKSQIDDINIANISTLHAFCINVLRRHFSEVEIDPAFRICEDFETIDLMDSAIESVFNVYYENEDQTFVALLEQFGGKEQRLKDAIIKVHLQLCALCEPETFLNKSCDNYKMDRQELEHSYIMDELFDRVIDDISISERMLKLAMDIIPDHPDFANYQNSVYIHWQMINGIYLKATGKDLTCFEDIAKLKPPLVRWPSKQKNMPEIKERIDNFRTAAREVLKKYSDDIMFDMNLQANLINAMQKPAELLSDIIRKFSDKYNELKNEKNLLDFSDLERLTLKILSIEQIREKYQDEFSFIFVDEYQDANEVQESIISLCCKGDNLFCVGDVKQSIYKFRYAEPKNFLSRQYLYENDQGGKLITLNQNFRSNENIINAVNDIFVKAMIREGELRYDKEDFLYLGREDGADSVVDVKILDKKESNLSGDEQEANAVADAILEQMEKTIYDPKLNQYRKTKYSDIVVLLRSTAVSAEVFARVLSSRSIKCYCELNSGYFEAIEVQVLINLLKLVDNAERDIELLSVIRSGITELTDEDIINIRKDNEKSSFYNAMKEAAEQDTALGAKCRGFFEFLLKAKRKSFVMDVEHLIEYILEETYYIAIISAMNFGEQRKANIELLLEKARQYCSVSTRNLAGFLYQMEILDSSSRAGEAQVISEGADCVKIMTIHRSKGLEFPVVIMARLGKQFNYADIRDQIVMHKDFGLGLKFFDAETRVNGSNIIVEAINTKLKQEIRAEELRLLYVGMTRAMERLILVGSVNDIARSEAKWQESINVGCLLDYVMQALYNYNLADVADDDFTYALKLNNQEDLRANWFIHKADINAKEALSLSKRDDFLQWKDKVINEKQNIIDFEGLKRFKSDIPSKIAVSNIDTFKEISFNEPEFVENKQLTGGLVGEAMHKVMQLIDIKQNINIDTIKRTMEQLKINEVITPAQASKLNPNTINNFFNSELGKRILNSNRVIRELHFTYLEKANKIFDTVSDDTVSMQGVIDICFIDGDEWVLIDYKTDYIKELTNEFIEIEREKHQSQVSLYAKALEKLTGIRVKEKYIVLLNKNYAIRV